jgi:hypothetical protein
MVDGMTTLNNFIALTLPLTGILVGMCGAVLALVGLIMSKRWSLQKKTELLGGLGGGGTVGP